MTGLGKPKAMPGPPLSRHWSEPQDDDSEPVSATATQSVVTFVRASIRNGGLRPGDRVRERDLVEACAVSRSAIREALRTLAAEGTIEIEHRRSAVVRRFSRAELWANHQIREALEGLAASLAASNSMDLGRRKALLDLEARMASCIENGQTEDYLQLNYRFHSLIVELSGNLLIQEHLDRAATAQLRMQSARFVSPDALAQSHTEHKAIIDAIIDGDPTAADAAMRRHIRGTRRTFLEMPDDVFGPISGQDAPPAVMDADRWRRLSQMASDE